MHVFTLKVVVCNSSWQSGIAGSETPTAVWVLQGQLYGFSPGIQQLPLQISLAPCSVSSSLFFIIPSSYFPSVFSTVASLSTGNMMNASTVTDRSQWVATLHLTPGRVFLIPVALQIQTRHLPIGRCSDVGSAGIIALSKKHQNTAQENIYFSHYMPYVKLRRTKCPSGRRHL